MENDNEVNCSIATLRFLDNNKHLFRPGFSAWVAQNWAIYLAFEQEAYKVIKKGFTHYSARTIGEYLRHETKTREDGAQYKLNDHLWPDMARIFAIRHPEHNALFEFRGSSLRSVPKHVQDYTKMHNEELAA